MKAKVITTSEVTFYANLENLANLAKGTKILCLSYTRSGYTSKEYTFFKKGEDFLQFIGHLSAYFKLEYTDENACKEYGKAHDFHVLLALLGQCPDLSALLPEQISLWANLSWEKNVYWSLEDLGSFYSQEEKVRTADLTLPETQDQLGLVLEKVKEEQLPKLQQELEEREAEYQQTALAKQQELLAEEARREAKVTEMLRGATFFKVESGNLMFKTPSGEVITVSSDHQTAHHGEQSWDFLYIQSSDGGTVDFDYSSYGDK